ncbi:3-oxoacyl-ACP reductase [bacterium F16]|nr:3-oxoacyl-ACP reductase [bacterium F16]
MADYTDLKNKIVLITGGSRGLGRAMAEAFVAQGSTVIITGRNQDTLSSAAEEIGAEGVVCDMTQSEDLSRLVEHIKVTYGRLDVLINNAGIHSKKPALDVTDDDFRQIIETNQTAVFALSRRCAELMLEAGSGSIIMVSSMASQYGIPNVISYSASKSAVEGMTRALTVEWAGKGIRINCIAPGFIETDMSRKALNADPERKAKVMGRTPMGRMGQPSDIASAACFLGSSDSAYITGVVLPVDGGNSIGF